MYEMQRKHYEEGVSKEELVSEHLVGATPYDKTVVVNVSRTISPFFAKD